MHTSRSSVLPSGLVHGAHRPAARHRPVHLDVAEHVLLLERRPLERQPQRLSHCAVRPVGADEIARADRPLPAVALQRRCDAVRILLEALNPPTAFDLHAVRGELLAKDPLGGVLRDRGEPERDIGGRRKLDLRDLLAVEVDHLAEHLGGRVEDTVQHPHSFEHLERTRLYPNGFGVLRWIGERVDDSEVDSPPGEFDRRRETDLALH